MLSNSSDPTSIFLASRLLFLITHDSSSVPLMRQMIENGNLLEITGAKMDVLVKHLGSDPMAKEGLSDMMKYIYNFMVHFSRAELGNANLVMGEAWSDKLGRSVGDTNTTHLTHLYFSSLVLPLISCFHSVPFSLSPSIPISAPMTNIIHCLLAASIENYKDAWYATPGPYSTNSSASNFFRTARSLFTSRSGSSSPPHLLRSDSNSKKVKSRNSSPSSRSSSTPSPVQARRSSGDSGQLDTVQRCINLVSSCLEHYFPANVEVDTPEVRNRANVEGVVLDELLAGPLLLLRKLADGDIDAKRKVKNWILPDDL
jgi:Guanine nucleotide exchange factor synembryn